MFFETDDSFQLFNWHYSFYRMAPKNKCIDIDECLSNKDTFINNTISILYDKLLWMLLLLLSKYSKISLGLQFMHILI